jgi:hypothetical protein
VLFNGEDSAGNTQEYASIEALIVSPTTTAEIGALDPASGRPLIESPVARLLQYAAVLRQAKPGASAMRFHASDRLRGEALAEWNSMSPEEQAPWSERA